MQWILYTNVLHLSRMYKAKKKKTIKLVRNFKIILFFIIMNVLERIVIIYIVYGQIGQSRYDYKWEEYTYILQIINGFIINDS